MYASNHHSMVSKFNQLDEIEASGGSLHHFTFFVQSTSYSSLSTNLQHHTMVERGWNITTFNGLIFTPLSILGDTVKLVCVCLVLVGSFKSLWRPSHSVCKIWTLEQLSQQYRFWNEYSTLTLSFWGSGKIHLNLRTVINYSILPSKSTKWN